MRLDTARVGLLAERRDDSGFEPCLHAGRARGCYRIRSGKVSVARGEPVDELNNGAGDSSPEMNQRIPVGLATRDQTACAEMYRRV